MNLYDKVKVIKYGENGERPIEIKRGIIVDFTSSFAKIFNPNWKKENEYDTTFECAEFFPISGKLIRIESR